MFLGFSILFQTRFLLLFLHNSHGTTEIPNCGKPEVGQYGTVCAIQESQYRSVRALQEGQYGSVLAIHEGQYGPVHAI